MIEHLLYTLSVEILKLRSKGITEDNSLIWLYRNEVNTQLPDILK